VASFLSESFLIAGDDPADLVDALVEVVGSPGSWVNVEPDVDDSARADVPGIFQWFSARGSQVPVGTFVSGSDRDRPSIGLDHGTGRGAGDRLEAAGIAVAEPWLLRQDNPKRGLVWEFVGGGVPPVGPVADLLLQGTALFCPLPTDGRFRVAVHTPRS